MALVPAFQSLPVEPTACLVTALREFEESLSEEQRNQYHESISKPDTSNVIKFVAKVDDNNKSRASRCVAPRLHTFLDKTQQFVGVVDTFVSSKPQVAALIWGSIKTAVLVVSHVSSYFDKVTTLIMNVGKFCPIYQQFGHLYPSCVELQEALCEHYAIVIRMCMKVIGVSYRAPAKQILSQIFSPFESDFGLFQRELEKSYEVIQLRISLATSLAIQEATKLAEFEIKESAHHRRRALKFTKISKPRVTRLGFGGIASLKGKQQE